MISVSLRLKRILFACPEPVGSNTWQTQPSASEMSMFGEMPSFTREPAQWLFEQDFRLNMMLQTAGQQEKGLPPAPEQQPFTCFPLVTTTTTETTTTTTETPGNDSEHDDHFKKWFDCGSASMDVGRENPSDKDRPKKRPLPFNSPFRTAREFGITEKMSTFLGLPELVDAEEIVPALRLDLKTATEVEVEIAIADGLSRLEEKYVFCFF